MKIRARALVSGEATGTLAALSIPLSLWGGLDPRSGKIIDQHHPQCGKNISDQIVAMPYARGSSSSSSALLEAARLGMAPAAFIMTQADPILTIGALVAEELYRVTICIVIIAPSHWSDISSATSAQIIPDIEQGYCELILP
jgi:predicted aconitase with swiveling domain